MGRIKDTAVTDSVRKRLDGTPPPEPEATKPPAPTRNTAKKATSRDGMKFIGGYVSEDQKEGLRVLAFETRRDHQDLIREALDLLFKKHGR